ncbi:MAG: hypothetical protein ACREXU_23725 [Gammaproteobacteria bacterium]
MLVPLYQEGEQHERHVGEDRHEGRRVGLGSGIGAPEVERGLKKAI